MSEEPTEDNKEETNVLSFEEEKERLKQQIELGFQDVLSSARETDEEEVLKYMNDRHAFINSYGGKPMVMSYVYSNTERREIIEFRSPDSISIQYSNKSVKVDKNYQELGKWWIRHSSRREYESILFDPSLPKVYNKCYNLYQGFNLEPAPGNWKRTLRHLYRVLCNSDREKFIYTVKWFAWCLQNPGQRAEIVMIFKGREGAGKGFIFSQFVDIFGNHGLHISNRKHLTGDFNGHLATCVFLFADEAYYPGDKEVEGALNQLISEEKIAIEKKHMNVTIMRNCLHIGMATNSEWVIPAAGEARRYFINKVENTYAKGQMPDVEREQYFNKLWDEMKNGGREAMVNDLLKIDLTDWHPRFNVPLTAELRNQASISIIGVNKIIAGFLDQGEFPGNSDILDTQYSTTAKGIDEFITKSISKSYDKIAPRLKASTYLKVGAQRVHSKAGSFWIFPPLKTCKENFKINIQKHYEFDDMNEVWSTGRVDI